MTLLLLIVLGASSPQPAAAPHPAAPRAVPTAAAAAPAGRSIDEPYAPPTTDSPIPPPLNPPGSEHPPPPGPLPPVEPVHYEVLVMQKRTVAFAKPSHASEALRLLYPGEILQITGEVQNEGQRWLRTPLDIGGVGFILAAKASAPGDITRTDWRPPHPLRDHRPFGVGAVWGGTTFGYGANFRYNLMSRLGISFTVGGIFDKHYLTHGGAWSLGLNSFLVLHNLSPMVELGINTLYYNAHRSMLRVWNFYTTLGLEYLFDFGMFINVHGSFIIAFSRSVSYDIDVYKQGHLGTDTFGPLDKPANKPFIALKPGITVGWTF